MKDTSFSASLSSVLPGNLVNEAYFNCGLRKAKFDSQVPSVTHQIAGTGFIGSNPFSPVDRTETRFQLRNNLTWATGSHIFKFGADFNWIDGQARFDLNFPALFNFSQQAAGSLVTGCDGPTVPAALRCPAFTAVQAYGLGSRASSFRASATRTANSATSRSPSLLRTPGRSSAISRSTTASATTSS